MTVFDLSIPVSFAGRGPGAFGAPDATRAPLETGGFVGAVASGGSCECPVMTFTPHCNGTHTESARHLMGSGPAPHELVSELLMPARVVSVTPGDGAITAAMLKAAWPDSESVRALIVRTLPNDVAKRTARWGDDRDAPYFSVDAIDLIVARGVDHLVFDGPSLDPMVDGGALVAHRAYFANRAHATATELAFVPDEARDGAYELNLQVAAFDADAAPSRPMIRPRQ
ncbi:MAG: cyclase family protein [Gammaproteobacteria bacterium]